MENIYAKILEDMSYMRWQEWLSTICQIASVWYARKNNILVYPTGIIGVILAAWVYFFVSDPPLYADGSLNIYYLIMSIYGWYAWQQTKDDGLKAEAYPISWCDQRERYIGGALFVGGYIILYFVLNQWTNSDVPMLDALVSSSAITAMWWMSRRKIENWIAWIVSNVVAIPLNFYKGFMLFTLMYVVFLVLAWIGFKAWREEVEILRMMNKQIRG